MFDKFLNSTNVGLKLYGVIYDKSHEKFIVKKINLLEETKVKLEFKVLQNLAMKKDYEVKKLEEYDNQKNILCEITEDQWSEKIKELLSNIKEDVSEIYGGCFSDIYGIFYKITNIDGDTLWIYKQNYSVNVISENVFSLILERDSLFKFLDKRIFKLNAESDFFIIKEKQKDKAEVINIYVDNLNVIERNFGMQEIIKKKAIENILEIEKLGLIDSVEVLEEKVKSEDMTFTRKLMKINKESPVFKIEKRKILEFVKKNKVTKDILKIMTKDGVENILLSTEREKGMFLKLLNDDILHSELTDMLYISNSKENGEINEEVLRKV